MRIWLVRGDRRGPITLRQGSVLLGALAVCLFGLAPPVAAQAQGKNLITYKATSASLNVLNSAKATLSNGDTWEGQDSGVWKGTKDKQADLILVGKPPYQMSVDSTFRTTGFEVLYDRMGVPKDCSGTHEPFTLPAAIIGARIERVGKKGKRFEATWTFTADEPSENCSVSYENEGQVFDFVKEDEKLGDEKLVLKTKHSVTQQGSDPDLGVTSYQHTTTWEGEVVLKKGGAVAG